MGTQCYNGYRIKYSKFVKIYAEKIANCVSEETQFFYIIKRKFTTKRKDEKGH